MLSINNYGTYLKIKDWDLSDRPREKLISKGASQLTETELLGILIGSGIKNMSAVDLAKNILKSYNNDLNKLAKCSVKELQKFKGIGEARAIIIVTALELARRKPGFSILQKPIIDSSQKAYSLIKENLSDKITEEFWVIFLNKTQKLISKHLVSIGGFSDTVVDPKIIFKKAFIENAVNIILIHNHPSGNIKPSKDDIIITKKLYHGANILDIKIIDHIIFSDFDYFSFADEGLL